MKIEMWPIENVKPYPGNPRLNDSAVKAVAASLKEFGWRQPIVVDKAGVIVVGHTRLKAAKSNGDKTVPVHVADMTPAQAKAYRIADNQTATLAIWDRDLLQTELSALKDLDVDLSTLGFNDVQLKDFMGIVPDFSPVGQDEQVRLDEKAPTICPKCGHEWVVR